MITIGVPAEGPDEPRIGLSPETAKKLVKLGAKMLIRSGAGLRSHFSDQEYKDAGAEIVGTDADAVKDADIVLTVRRGKQPPFDVTLQRAIIKIESVRSEVLNNSVGYVRITSFSEQTGSGLQNALAKIKEKTGDKLVGLVLDLRNDPGGLLDQAIAVGERPDRVGADLFLDRLRHPAAGPQIPERGRTGHGAP
jgi:hypothetical protein